MTPRRLAFRCVGLSRRLVGYGRRKRQPALPNGFAAIDALVALVILTTTIGLSITAAAQSRRLATAAAETRGATAVLQQLADRAPSAISSGTTSGFEWRILVSRPDTDPLAAHLATCRMSISARSVSDRQRFGVSTLVSCAPEPAQ